MTQSNNYRNCHYNLKIAVSLISHKLKTYQRSVQQISKFLPMSEIIRGTSQKGKPVIIVDGHQFNLKRKTKSTEHWRCAKYYTLKCSKTIVISILTGRIVEQNQEHTHDITPGEAEARQVMHQMKTEVRNEHIPVNSSVIARSLQPLELETAIQLSLPSR